MIGRRSWSGGHLFILLVATGDEHNTLPAPPALWGSFLGAVRRTPSLVVAGTCSTPTSTNTTTNACGIICAAARVVIWDSTASGGSSSSSRRCTSVAATVKRFHHIRVVAATEVAWLHALLLHETAHSAHVSNVHPLVPR